MVPEERPLLYYIALAMFGKGFHHENTPTWWHDGTKRFFSEVHPTSFEENI